MTMLSEEMSKWLDHQDSTLDDDVCKFIEGVTDLEKQVEEIETALRHKSVRVIELEGGEKELQATIRARNDELANSVPFSIFSEIVETKAYCSDYCLLEDTTGCKKENCQLLKGDA